VTACVGDNECRRWNAENNGIDGLPNEGLHSRTNPHWRPQILVANLNKYLHLHNFVGNMSFLGNHTYQLLHAKGLWDEYGKDGWGKSRRVRIFDHNTATHRTGTKSKIDRFYTPAMLRRVHEAYAMDYKLFEILGTSRTVAPVRGYEWEGFSIKDLDPRLEGTGEVPPRKSKRKQQKSEMLSNQLRMVTQQRENESLPRAGSFVPSSSVSTENQSALF
jgi:hypothetical protein